MLVTAPDADGAVQGMMVAPEAKPKAPARAGGEDPAVALDCSAGGHPGGKVAATWLRSENSKAMRGAADWP